MTEFTHNGYEYRAGQIDAMTQFHIVRRLAPMLSAFKDVASPDGSPLTADALGPVAAALGRVPDNDIEYVIGKTLAVVTRRKEGDTGYVKIWNAVANRPQFEDIGMPDMLMITMHVVQGALSPFLSGLPFKSSGGAGE